ncbi:MAG: subclass B3 metallo-beta-lactamase [Acidobacteria bacterium]|nr:subclass B3 metallo-beta-lactamase [Acidobacteriota bacterium]
MPRACASLLAVLLLTIPALATVRAQFDTQAWLVPTEPLRIAGPVHYVGTRELAAYLIATPAGHILIDGALPASAGDLERSIVALGFRLEDVKVLLTTQAHFDHVGTLAQLKARTRGRLLVMDGDQTLLASGGATDYLFATTPGAHFPPVTADEVIHDGHRVTLGGVSLQAHLTPGHTPGTTTWTTTIADHGKAYRVVFTGSTGVNSGTRFVKDPSYPGILQDYRKAFRVLESLQPDIFLAAHSGQFDLAGKRARAATEGATAFVDPDGYRRALATSKATFERLVDAER